MGWIGGLGFVFFVGRSLLPLPLTCRDMRYAMSPLPLVEPHFAAPNRVLVGGGYTVHPLVPHPVGLKQADVCFDNTCSYGLLKAYRCGLSCASILHCDLSPLAARALTSPRTSSHAGPLPASYRRASQGNSPNPAVGARMFSSRHVL